MAVLLGIEPSSFLINSQAHTPCLLEHNKLVADAGVEPTTEAYETSEIPFL